MRAPRDTPQSDGYSRPQQAWQCGLSDEGPPCALGPTGWGLCPAAADCHPMREGDRWTCNRSPLRGGPCSTGPAPDGSCAVVHRCTPLRSLRSRRRRFIVGCLVAVLGGGVMAMGGAWRNELLVPGPLSAHHAHLAGGANATMRCAQCHEGANGTIGQWLGLTPAAAESSDASAGAAATQIELCMKCHSASIPPVLATTAHNLPWDELKQPASGHGRRDAAAAIACAACHQEHQGRMHDLTAMTNEACQACHQEEYHSFAQGHPEFGHWPYARRTRIMFDHASHQLKHYPVDKKEFACSQCHGADSSGAVQLTKGYETSCASCHDKALMVSLEAGVPFLALPTLDVAALSDAGVDVAPWPADADGDFDGAVPALAKLMVAADPAAAEALAALGPKFDYYDIDPEDEQQVKHGAAVARELKELVDDLAARGQAAVAERLSAVLGRDAAAAELAALSAQLSPEAARAYRDRWFSEAGEASDDEETPAARGSGGGWFRDDTALSLRYQPAGHADPWLRGWLDALAAAATGPRAAIAEPLLRAALVPTAPGQCGSCHSIERTATGNLAIQWRAFHGGRDVSDHGLTYFSHASHVLQTQLNDCAACHEITPQSATNGAYASDDPHQFVVGFAAMTKATCSSCHTPTAAGDRCTQCHRYHGDEAGDWRLEAGGSDGGSAALLAPAAMAPVVR